MILTASPLVGSSEALADRVDDLSRDLEGGRHEKTRVAAASSLAKLRDPRAVKPLTRALRDRSAMVRALAAGALGNLGDPAALPALQRAQRDPSRLVRRRADEAIAQIRRQQESAASAGTPRIHVMLKTASDDSVAPGVRKDRSREVRALMARRLVQSREVTLVASDSRDPSIDPYAIDLTVVKLERTSRGKNIEVACEIRVAISTRAGKMLSFLTGGAAVQVPKASFRDEFLPQVQREALEGAVRSVHRDLVAYLARLHRGPAVGAARRPPGGDSDL